MENLPFSIKCNGGNLSQLRVHYSVVERGGAEYRGFKQMSEPSIQSSLGLVRYVPPALYPFVDSGV